MFEKILFPTDFSTHAEAELKCLAGFPHIREIVLLHIVKKFPIPMVEEIVAKTTQGYLNEARTYLQAFRPGIVVSIAMVTSSDVAGAILDSSEKSGTDLIVVSGYVRSFKADIFLHRVPSTVLCRVSNTDVLVMPNALLDTLRDDSYDKFCTNIFSRILCPTDGSDLSVKNFTRTGGIPGAREILLLHVIRDPAGDEMGIRGRLAVLRDSLAAEGMRVHLTIARGVPAREISRIAEEDVSLIAMTPSGQGCFASFLSGSLVHDVMMNSKRPVLVMRSGE